MAQLCLTARIRGQTTTACTFTISVDGSSFVAPNSQILDQSIFIIADDAASIVVRAEPIDVPKYRTLECELAPQIDGGIVMVQGPAEFEPPTVLITPVLRTYLQTVHLSSARDATERSRECLNPVGPDYPGHPPAPAPGDMSFRGPFVSPLPPADITTLEFLADVTCVKSPAISNGQISVEALSLAPAGAVAVISFPTLTAPQLFAVYWPNSVPRGPGVGPTPFLVYFHPTMGQNAPQFYADARDRHDPMTGKIYPWGFDYHFFGWWRYFNYFGDPFTVDPFCKGLPYQVEAAAKPVVLVLPLNRVASNPCDEISTINDAATLQECLEEIQGVMFRAAGNFQTPGVGRLAMASFSSGHSLLSCFLTRAGNSMHPLYSNNLQEVYLFDPHADLASETLIPVMHVASWAAAGTPNTKVARLYTQNSPTTLAPVLGRVLIIGQD
jgi:hypothetical protein